ncbi:MAG: hypothetical protein K2H08_05560, partial [Duncaniella sp.]|nr:hypothetical protein [Duncaniella sp.]
MMNYILRLLHLIIFMWLALMSAQLFMGIMQLVGIIESRHPYYIITGSFYNSGPYACFLAIGFPIALRMIGDCNNKFQKWLGMGIVLCCAILIPATMSRTAVIACVIGGIIATADKLNMKRLGKTRLLIAGILCVIIAGGIYLMKKNSADGRFLMCKVAVQAVAEAPI